MELRQEFVNFAGLKMGYQSPVIGCLFIEGE